MKKKSELTELGKVRYLKSANKAAIYRKTNLSETRLSLLSNDPKTVLMAEEAYLIAMAMDVDPGELLKQVFRKSKLNSFEEQEKLANKIKNKKT